MNAENRSHESAAGKRDGSNWGKYPSCNHLFNPLASVVVFQYNPDTMTRRLEPRTASGDGEWGEASWLAGPAKETISLSVEIDATDQLGVANAAALKSGITPTLAALEMMLYPKSALVIASYSRTGYTRDFAGTSSACPTVAGVGALVLSANPNLTVEEVRDILQSNTRKANRFRWPS